MIQTIDPFGLAMLLSIGISVILIGMYDSPNMFLRTQSKPTQAVHSGVTLDCRGVPKDQIPMLEELIGSQITVNTLTDDLDGGGWVQGKLLGVNSGQIYLANVTQMGYKARELSSEEDLQVKLSDVVRVCWGKTQYLSRG
jgi:hypothetical protein